jgi:hypothetical protein
MNEDQYLKIEGWLKSIDSRLNRIESILTPESKASSTRIITQPPGIEKLAISLNCSTEDIYNIISFENDRDFTFLFNIDGKKESDKQLNATLSLLTVLYYCNGEDEMTVTDLKKKLEFWGIKSLDHLSHTLKKQRQLIVLKGKGRGSKFNYKITQPGLVEGIKILSEKIKTKT